MSTRPVVFNLVNCIIGVSVLAMPFCFQECGIILCAVAILSSSWLTKKSCQLLLKSGQVTRRRNYEGLALATYGAPGKLAVETSTIGLLLGTLIAFNVIIGDLVPSIFHNLTGVQVSWTVRAVLMTILAFGVGLPLSLMRNLHSLASFSALSLIFYMGFVVQIFMSALPGITEGSWIYDLNYWRPQNLLGYLPIFALAFACQTQLFALYETLPEPSVKIMEGVINTGINIVALVYFSVGLFGYICFYSIGVKGDMLNNYGNTLVSYIIKLGFVMSVIVSFPLMVYPLRASLHSLIFQQSSNSENLPGGASFIPQDRFTYLTVSIISGTLLLGVLFPQIEFVLALTGATMGTLIAFVFPSAMFLHVVSEQTHSRLIAKLVLVLGLVCFVTGTYTVLMAEKSVEHANQVDIHPPGIDPIKSMGAHDSIQNPVFIRESSEKTNHTSLHVNGGPVDMDVAKIGLEGGNALKVDQNIGVEDSKPGEEKPLDVKLVDAGVDERLNLKADEPVKPVKGEAKRQEPPVPHAPQDKDEQGAPDERHGEDEHLNDKRQLMSNNEEGKLSNHGIPLLKEVKVDEVIPARNVADTKQVKVSEQEIDEELKKLEQSDKVSEDVSVRQGGAKEAAHLESAVNEQKPVKDSHENALVKRDIHQSQDSTKIDDEVIAADKREKIAREEKHVLEKIENQANSQERDLDAAEYKELSDTGQHSQDKNILPGSENKTSNEEIHDMEQSIKIRDLKSKRKPMKMKRISVSSKSLRMFLSKQHALKSKRSNPQGEAR